MPKDNNTIKIPFDTILIIISIEDSKDTTQDTEKLRQSSQGIMTISVVRCCNT